MEYYSSTSRVHGPDHALWIHISTCASTSTSTSSHRMPPRWHAAANKQSSDLNCSHVMASDYRRASYSWRNTPIYTEICIHIVWVIEPYDYTDWLICTAPSCTLSRITTPSCMTTPGYMLSSSSSTTMRINFNKHHHMPDRCRKICNSSSTSTTTRH